MKYRDPSTGQFRDLHFKVSDTLPIGFIGAYSGVTAPEGWLICDGAAVSRTAYSALFAAIGTTYGAGDGSTTFNLPDYRDRVPVGLDANDTDFNLLGKKVGSKSNTYDLTHSHTQGATGSTTLTINQIPSHNHIQRLDYDTSYNWQVTSVTSGNATGACIAEGTEVRSSKKPIETVETGGGQGHTHTNPATNNALGNTTISTIQQSIVTNYIIKAYQVVAAPAKVTDLFPVGKVEIFFDNEDHSNYLGFTWERIAQGRTLIGIDSTDSDFDTIGEFGGSKTHTLTIDEMPSHHHRGTTDVNGKHRHSLYFDRTSGSASGIKLDTNVNNVYTTSDYVSEAGEHAHTFTTNGAGGGQAHNIMNPYVVVAYWRRVS